MGLDRCPKGRHPPARLPPHPRMRRITTPPTAEFIVTRSITVLLAFALALAGCDHSPSGPETGPPILSSISPAAVAIGVPVTITA